MSKAGRRRLFAFLGTGNYCAAEYNWKIAARKGRTSPLQYIQTALCKIHTELDQPIDEVVLFLTRSAKSMHLKKLKGELFDAGITVKVRSISIPNGDDEEQLWDLFTILTRELSRQSTSLIFDITHGFRALPWFAAAVLTFLSATKRLPEDTSVYYGLFRPKGQSSIVGLTAALDVVTWGFGLTQFLNSGKWDPRLSSYLQNHTKSLNEKLTADGGRSRDFFNGLNSRLTKVSDALSLIRVGELLLKPSPKGQGLLRSLLEVLDASEADVQKHIPPLAAVLDEIRKVFKGFEASKDLEALNDQVGLEQLDQLILLYEKWERYPEASTVLREAFTTLFCNESCATNPTISNSRFSNDCRDFADIRCNAWINEHHRGLFKFRNDINHAGFNADPHSKSDLVSEFDKALKVFRNQCKHKDNLRKPLFLNISNHPVNTWCENQKEAALVLAEEIVDVPFPRTDPSLSEKKVRELANKTIKQLEKANLLTRASHALVMGDFSLTFVIVSRLKSLGLHCWVTTTDRKKDDTFHFVRFRKV
ncbi:MAG: TM1812 family CRISPR-associated protein [Vulcanimicrobiota bacterium]